MKKSFLYHLIFILFSGITVWAVSGNTNRFYSDNRLDFEAEHSSQDSARQDGELLFPIKESSGNPYLQKEEGGVIDLEDPENIEYRTEYDARTNQVTIYRKIGGMDIRLPYTMTLEEYMDMDTRHSIMSYWHQRQQMETGQYSGSSIFNQQFKFGGEAFNSIFGSNLIDIKLQGNAELKVGFTRNKIDNPTLQERLRKTTNFDFEENIQMNIDGSIGDKMKMGISYNTQALFDFENQVKLEYTGKEDEIVKKVEAGNVSLPLPGTLITGSQSLFGVKTEMQFGKLSVTSIFSQQKGESQVMNIQGGATSQEFEVSADEYDRNRHFFLSHTFRNRYDGALESYPLNSDYTIEKIEVWVTNKTGNFNESRNILAFLDLAESGSNISNPMWTDNVSQHPKNDANSLYSEMNNTYNQVRDINQVTTIFQSISNFEGGIDYEKVENARLLSPSEYTYHANLGYISLNSALQADEVLAVSYEYVYKGQTFKVGEFSNDQSASSTLYLKLLKGTALTPNIKTWDLMMKNIYAIGAYQINSDDFILDITLMNDSTGSDINYFPKGDKAPQGINGELLLKVMELDRLNSQMEPYPDGVFDFWQGTTINAQNGRIIFPVLEPFGSNLEEKLLGQKQLIDQYVFHELYDSTQTVASQTAEKNKFKLKGTYKSSSSSEISLNAMNIPQGSVVVTAGGIKLKENIDYTVDYSMGRIKIINSGLLESGTPIQVSLESQSMYNLQTKTLLGTHMDYKFNDRFNTGFTLMHLRERPLTQKVNIGDEPIANTIWGFNGSYTTQSQALTNLIDKLPLVSVTKPSNITIEGEFAHLIPGHPNIIEKEGNAYIDDFEGTKIAYDMKNWTSWKLSSVPQGQSEMFPNANLINDRRYGYGRSKLAWYVIDPLFLRNTSYTPSHIRNDEDQLSNHFVREIFEAELFPNKQAAYGEATNIPVLNLAYYPKERGPYNYDTDFLNADGNFTNPSARWGGIMRKIETNDFEAANIEYIEFWLMDPFVYDDGPTRGGDLYFNLGNISEDILRDSRKSFEQGLPVPGEEVKVDTTQWGIVARRQSTVNAFNTEPAARKAQDIGLDGLVSEDQNNEELNFFSDYVNTLETSGVVKPEILEIIKSDPSTDNYHYFRGSDFDDEKTPILDRYKNYNNPEGNSVATEYSPENYSTAASSIPDVEDINLDNTLSENESYFQYKVELRPDRMVVGQNYITNMVDTVVSLKNGKKEQIRWYQFKIPLSEPDDKIGTIEDWRSIRFMRMFMTNCEDTMILRFASLDLVRGEWRKYTNNLFDIDDQVVSNPATEFVVSAVNIEEDATKTPVSYVLPVGVDRVTDPANPQLRELNEQSISLKVVDLNSHDARAVYKTMNMDFRQYKRLKMEIHAEEVTGYPLADGEISAFIRLGTDYQNNYYEYEIPLSITSPGKYSNNNDNDRYAVWPEENRLNLALDKLLQVKLKRNDAKRESGSTVTLDKVYEWNDPDNDLNMIKIKGNPSLATVKTIMIGIRVRGNEKKSAEVWMNELRLTDFDESGGWAANVNMKIDLSDLGSVSMAGKTSSVGFGSIDKSVTERSQEDFYQYDIATNLEAGKLLGPQSRLSVPFYFGYSKSISNPKYYPLDPDVPLKVALRNAENEAARDSIRKISQAVTSRKSINFTNVKLNQKEKGKPNPLSLSNLSVTYSYNETNKRDINTEFAIDKSHRGLLAYNYNARPKAIEPFKKNKTFADNKFALIRDFNFYLLPNVVSYRWEIIREYSETQLRNISNPDYILPSSVSKDFDWNRYFDLNYNLTKSLRLDFKSTTNARIDEPDGVVDKDRYKDEYQIWKDEVMENIMNFGRTTNYRHTTNITYQVPVNKIPMLEWTSLNVRYGSMYTWILGPMTRTTFDNGQEDLIEYKQGNIIKNSNNIDLSSNFTFKTLYNKISYLKDLERKYNTPVRRNNNQTNKRTERYNKENVSIEEGKPLSINHKLKTEEISVRIFDANGRPVEGETKVVNANRVLFIPKATHEKVRVAVTGTIEDVNTPFTVAKDYTALFLTGFKTLSVQYAENNGTTLPGYLNQADFMGMERGFSSPGIPFAFGRQDRHFASDAARRNRITTDTTLNAPYIMTSLIDFNVKTTFEPIKGLRLDLNAEHKYQHDLSEYYVNGSSNASGTRYKGSMNMSFNMIRTAFWKTEKSGTYHSKAYENFLTYRNIIARRLSAKRDGMTNPETGDTYQAGSHDGYNNLSQDVLVPAFVAAYSGKDPHRVFLTSLPGINRIQPNWRLTYDGLSRISWLKKYIKSFEITHTYKSNYTVGSYITNSAFSDAGDGISWIRDSQDNFIPRYQMNSVSLSESFSPLIQFNITWMNSLNTRAEIKKTRILNLSLSNNQIIENYTNEFVIGLGYRIDQLKLNIGNKSYNSDLNLKADLSIRDNLAIIRKIEEEVDQLTSGQKVVSVKFTADYAMSDRFNMQLFYDTNVNTPYISLSYPTSTSNFGVSFRFSLTQ